MVIGGCAFKIACIETCNKLSLELLTLEIKSVQVRYALAPPLLPCPLLLTLPLPAPLCPCLSLFPSWALEWAYTIGEGQEENPEMVSCFAPRDIDPRQKKVIW